MKIFSFFVEPATYTVDLKKSVYDKLGINSTFIYNNTSIAKSSKQQEFETLENLSLLKRICYIYNVFKKNQFIIVNGYNNFVFILIFLVNKLSVNKRKLAIESDTPLNLPSNYLKRLFKNFFLTYLFRHNWILGFAGGTTKHKELFRYYGMPEKNIFTMPMVINNKRYSHREKKTQIGVCCFLFVGRIVDCKNIEYLLSIFNTWSKDKPDAKLSIIGDGELLDRLKKFYTSSQISFLGSVDSEHLSKYYYSSDVFILPSSFEPWGLVVNEAMASGLPVIVSSAVGAADDLVGGHKTGLIFSLDNKLSLIEQLDTMYFNKNLRLKYGENAFKHMHNYWNYDLYRSCLLSAIQATRNNVK